MFFFWSNKKSMSTQDGMNVPGTEPKTKQNAITKRLHAFGLRDCMCLWCVCQPKSLQLLSYLRCLIQQIVIPPAVLLLLLAVQPVLVSGNVFNRIFNLLEISVEGNRLDLLCDGVD